MPEPEENLADAATAAIIDALKGFLEREEVKEFAAAQAKVLAREFYRAQTAATEAEKAEHLANIEHLRAQVKGEAARLVLAVSNEARDTLRRVVEGAAGFLAELLKRGLKVTG